MAEKIQPWKAAWPPVDAQTNATTATTATTASTAPAPKSATEYGIAKGQTIVVDGTAANVHPATPSRTHNRDTKTQPQTTIWATTTDATAAQHGVDYGVTKGETVVVDGTAANVTPRNKTVRVGRA